MDRKIAFSATALIFGAILFIFSRGFHRNIPQRKLSDNSIIFGGTRIDELDSNIYDIEGNAWRTSEGEFGYFTARIPVTEKEEFISAISKFVGVPHQESKADYQFINSKWKSIYEQFSNKSIPVKYSAQMELYYYKWNSDVVDIDITLNRENENMKVYSTWYRYAKIMRSGISSAQSIVNLDRVGPWISISGVAIPSFRHQEMSLSCFPLGSGIFLLETGTVTAVE